MNEDRGSFTNGALEIDVTSVGVNDGLADGQSESRTARISMSGGINSVEPLEDVS